MVAGETDDRGDRADAIKLKFPLRGRGGSVVGIGADEAVHAGGRIHKGGVFHAVDRPDAAGDAQRLYDKNGNMDGEPLQSRIDRP